MSHPEAQLARSALVDAAIHYVNDKRDNHYDISRDPHHLCVLSCPKGWHATKTEIDDLSILMLGHTVDQFDVQSFAIAQIMGVHFRAREWEKYPRCGSVVTCVLAGTSLYGRVDKFFSIQGDDCPGYASVRWFGSPIYPEGTPLVVKVSEDGSRLRAAHGSVIPITKIDPSRVMVEFSKTPNTYYVMRDSGYDTIRE